MKNVLTSTLAVLFCTLFSSVGLMGQLCNDDDPTSKGIIPTTILGDNTPKDACLKFDPPVAGTLALDSYGNTITIVKTTGSCGEVLSWSVPDNIVVDAIYAKGSNGYNIYDYSGKGLTSDGGLHCPIAGQSGMYADFSHYNICFHYKLGVSKTASTSFTRSYTWDIKKACLGASELTLKEGQTFTYPFSWTATNTGYNDSDFKVSGTISIVNSTPYPATITSIADILSDGTGATISGFPTLPFTLNPGESAAGTYDAYPADGDAGTNTVTVTTSTPEVEGNTGKANYSFGSPTTEVDKCITVTDDCQGGSFTICVTQSPYTSSYSCVIGPYACNTDATFTNTVSFIGGSGASGSAKCSVAVHVPACGVGCTLTQGYWKTHSSKGPAKADPTWDLVGGPNATFYLSGKTWYQVFWTAPAGNAYYILAQQFMAARLNILSGASTTAEVDACMAFAQTFFSSKTPSSKLTTTDRNKVLNCATTLDNYNNGVIGPGHCDEDASSAASLPKVDRPLATNVQPNDYKLHLAPNPATSEVQINLSSFIGMDVEIKLTDRLGRTVLAQKLNNLEISTYNLQLNTLSIPTGIYQVTVRSNELLLTEPLVIQTNK